MAWDDEMVGALRALILDLDDPPTYADDRLAKLVLIGAALVAGTAKFKAGYVASLPAGTLTPDPTLPESRDDAFALLAVLRAALVLATAEAKLYAAQGITIKEGQTEMRLNRDAKGIQLVLEGYQQQYDDALFAFRRGGGAALGRMVCSTGGGGPDWGWCRVPGWDR